MATVKGNMFVGYILHGCLWGIIFPILGIPFPYSFRGLLLNMAFLFITHTAIGAALVWFTVALFIYWIIWLPSGGVYFQWFGCIVGSRFGMSDNFQTFLSRQRHQDFQIYLIFL